MKNSFHERYRYALLAAVVCLLPLVVIGAMRAMATNANDVRTWLPQGLPETAEYASFSRHFGSEEFVAVSWEGCTLDDPRLVKLADALAPRDDSTNASLIESVLNGPKSLDELMSPPLNLSRDDAVARLRGLMIGPDGQQSCAVVRPTERGKHNPHELLETIRRAAQSCGVPRNELHMGGPPVTSTAIDDDAAASMTLPGPLSVLAALVFSWFCFRSLRLTLLVIAVGMFSAATALAVVWFSGGEMNAVLLSMPPLVYVSTVSGAIHWANYYREEVQERGLLGASGRAVAHARLPLLLATGTTAMGLLSLCASELLPIRQFGIYTAIGVAAALLCLLVVLPAGCALWPLRKERSEEVRAGKRATVDWRSWGQQVARRSGLITVLGLGLAMLCGLGLYRVKTSVSAEGFFKHDAEFPTNSRWLEEHLGGMVPMEVVVRFGPACKLNMLERMELVDRAQQSVASLDDVTTSVSAVTFSPQLPGDSDGGWSVERSLFNRKLVRHRDRFVDAGFLASDGPDELWRISLRTRSFHDVDQRYFIDTVRQRVEPVLKERGGDGISATFTGMVPLINRAQQSLLQGLGFGLVTDLVLIVLTIVVLMRHWSVGLVMFITGLFPTLTVLGAMGWLGITLDIGTVLAPSVALGVTVDDVLHFVLWYRRGLEQGLDRQQSVRLAYAGCARAMYQSWGVIGLGLSIFALSDFTPTCRFGLLMVLLLSVGLVVNLVLLPALLAGPLGGFFARRVHAVKNTVTPTLSTLAIATATDWRP
jgi:predicted RND superfamily exporter protein